MGNTQIINGTIENNQIAAAAAIATTKLADGLNFIKKDGSVTMTGDFNMGAHVISNLAEPTLDHHAATKFYVDSTAQGLIVKDAARLATTANLNATYEGTGHTLTGNANGALSVDGKLTAVGNRILVKDQTTASQNGVYEVTEVGDASNPFVLTRAADMDGSPASEIKGGVFTFIQEGTVNSDSGWVVISDGAITLDSSAVEWTQFSGAGQVTAGLGLIKTGNTLDVNVASTGGIEVNGDAVQIKLAANSGLNTTANGLSVDSTLAGNGLVLTAGALDINLAANGGLQLNSDELAIKLDSSSALVLTSGGLAVDSSIAGAGLAFNSGVVSIAASAAGNGLSLTAGVLDINIAAAGGLQIVTDNVGIKLAANSGLSLSGSGLTVDPSIAGNGLTWTSGVLSLATTSAGAGLSYNAGVLDVVASATGGLQIVADEVAIKLATNSALVTDANGLRVDSSIAGAGLQFSAGVVSIASSAAGNALSYSAGTLHVETSATGGLQIVSDALSIKLASNSALALSAGGLAVDSSIAGNGLSFAAGVLSLATTSAGAGLSYTAGVLDVVLSATGGLEIVNDDEVAIKLDTNSALVLSASGLTVASTIAGSGLTWTDGVLDVVGKVSSTLDNGFIYRGNVSNTATAYHDIHRESPTTSDNTVYTLAEGVLAGTEYVFVNGILQKEGLANDYSVAGNEITFTSANQAGDIVVVSYLGTGAPA